MIVILVDDDGKFERIHCRKVEPTTLNQGKIIIDEDRVVDIRNVIRIVEG